MMERHKKQMVETRRLYMFENLFNKELPAYTRKDRSIEFLRGIAGEVWGKHGRKNVGCPSITAGRGLPSTTGAQLSYSDGYKKIVLARSQRTIAVLLHELTHAMGYGAFPNGHGRGFVKKQLDLLEEYGQCDREELQLAMGLFNIRA